MSENTIRIVRHLDFIKTVETSLGHPVREAQVAVVSSQDTALSDRVSSPDLAQFITRMIKFNKDNGITSGDVAVVTQEQMMRDEMEASQISQMSQTSQSNPQESSPSSSSGKKFGKK